MKYMESSCERLIRNTRFVQVGDETVIVANGSSFKVPTVDILNFAQAITGMRIPGHDKGRWIDGNEPE
jgi:hypothetical protein